MTQKTVVVAIDATDVQDRFAVALQGAGHRAISVRHPRELFAAFEEHAGGIDLVVLDARLQTDGLGIVPTFLEAAPDVPLIIFSGSIQDAREMKELAALGVTSFVNEHITVQRVLPSLAPLLFPDSFDRRTSPRFILGIPAALKSGDAITAVLTLIYVWIEFSL